MSPTGPSSFSQPVYYALLAVLVTLWLCSRSALAWLRRARGRSCPPGPRGLPILGNGLVMLSSKPWYALRDISAKYGEHVWCHTKSHPERRLLGDIVHLNILSQHFIILTSPQANVEFMEKHTRNSSDRRVTPTIRLYVFFRFGSRYMLSESVTLGQATSGFWD